MHIGKEIEQALQLKGMSAAELARRIGDRERNVQNMLRRPNCDALTLKKISEVLAYDLFAPLRPSDVKITAKEEEIKELNTAIDDLKARLAELESNNDQLDRENEILKREVALLKDIAKAGKKEG